MVAQYARLWTTLYIIGCSVVTAWKSCNLKDMGAVGDGVSSDDSALQRALACCEDGGGCTLEVPSGTYLLGPFNLTSNMDLYLSEEDSVLLADASRMYTWPLVEEFPSYNPGDDNLRLTAFIGGSYITNTTIRGPGTIDGQGGPWYDAWAANELPTYGRPRLVEPMYCSHFTMRGVTVRNPPMWAIHPYACEHIVFENVIFSAPLDSPNTDGIDPDSCAHVRITNLTVVGCGDDAISIKSGKDEWGRAFATPSHDILIEGGSIGPSSGIDLGSEMSGGIYNVLVRGVHFYHTLFAVRIKSGRGRGGYVRNATHEDLTLDQVPMGIAINMHYAHETNITSPLADTTPHLDGLTYRRIRGNALNAGGLFCLPEAPCRGVLLEDVYIDSRAGGFECAHVEGITRGLVSPAMRCLQEDLQEW
jgi:polygalacturonase